MTGTAPFLACRGLFGFCTAWPSSETIHRLKSPAESSPRQLWKTLWVSAATRDGLVAAASEAGAVPKRHAEPSVDAAGREPGDLEDLLAREVAAWNAAKGLIARAKGR